MGQDCSVYSAWMGHCHWTEMLNGEVIVGAVAAILLIWQIIKQEKLTREQIAATMEATQKQLEEMKKAQEPEVEIFLDNRREGLIIDLFNFKSVPVPIKGYGIEFKSKSGGFYWTAPGEEDIVVYDEKIIRMGESYKLPLSKSALWSAFKEGETKKSKGIRESRETLQCLNVYFYAPVEALVTIEKRSDDEDKVLRLTVKSVTNKKKYKPIDITIFNPKNT